MAKPKKVEWQGKKLDGQSMDFTPLNESWSEYRLENGGTVKVRVVLSEVVVVANERTETGDPLVLVKSATLVDYQPPENSDVH